jgi:tetratricopeptide (TPR) repeat protein
MRVHVFAIAAAGMIWAAATLSSAPQSPQDLVNQAHRLDVSGKLDAAIALYRRALRGDPGSFDAHYGIARALDLTDHYEEARPHFVRAIELASDGEKDQALRMMGVSYVFTGQTIEAAGYFEQVFKRRMATDNVVAAAEVANELGRVYLESGDLKGARTWYQRGYDTAGRERDRTAASVDLAKLRWAHAQGRIAARQGDAPEARRQTVAVKRLLDQGTNEDQQSQYPYLLGYVHFYLRDYPAAATELRKAEQDDPFIMVLLAETYRMLGEADRASEYYRKALASSSHAVNNAFARRIARQRLK